MADDDDENSSKNPNLVKLLTDRLPALGLDYETYGPYVWGVVDTTDEDELAEVMQLLQASSEEFAEDESKWTQLLADIQAAIQSDKQFQKETEQKKVESERIKMEQDLAKAKLEQEESSSNAKAGAKRSSVVDDETKKALMQRYAYEEDGVEDGGGGKAGGASATPEVATNRQVAAQANLERAKEMRSKKVQTKKEEQQKTKEQRQNKEKLKEERRKKTTKGERKR